MVSRGVGASLGWSLNSRAAVGRTAEIHLATPCRSVHQSSGRPAVILFRLCVRWTRALRTVSARTRCANRGLGSSAGLSPQPHRSAQTPMLRAQGPPLRGRVQRPRVQLNFFPLGTPKYKGRPFCSSLLLQMCLIIRCTLPVLRT